MIASTSVIDLFAGAGGWDQGLRRLGVHAVVGVELDPAACATRRAAGLQTIQADVATIDPRRVGHSTEGLTASPPCQAFSRAGLRRGMLDRQRLLDHLRACARGWVPLSHHEWADTRSPLILEPLRWAYVLRPHWVAFEQVPDCMPLWEATLEVLAEWGYRGYTKVLNAADFGVPQTRRRAVLVASRLVRAMPPEPTHAKAGAPGGLPPWVSMATALGWDPRLGPPKEAPGCDILSTGQRSRRAGAMVPYETTVCRPGPTVTTKSHCQWYVRLNNQANATVRRLDEPAPTVFCGHSLNTMAWIPSREVRPGPMRGGNRIRGRVPVQIAQLGVLQTFPADYPWSGTKTQRGRQVGNAIPPLLAAAVLRPVVNGRPTGRARRVTGPPVMSRPALRACAGRREAAETTPVETTQNPVGLPLQHANAKRRTPKRYIDRKATPAEGGDAPTTRRRP